MGSRLGRRRKKKFKWNNNASIAPEDDTLQKEISEALQTGHSFGTLSEPF